VNAAETAHHLGAAELQAGLERIAQAPRDAGRVELVVRRPGVDRREVLEVGELDPDGGLVGDRWIRGKRGRPPNPQLQLTLMAARVTDLVAGGERERWALAGDQLYVDLDLSEANLPAGTQLRVGTATIEVSALPHTGCKKFVSRFGLPAMLFVNADAAARLRGLNARVVEPGLVRPGDEIRKLP
jgi:MOSC domain-containing protein YiiM